MALYSVIEFNSVMMPYWVGSNLTDNQYLYVDLCEVLPLACVMSQTGAHSSLSKDLPTPSLVSRVILLSIIGQVDVSEKHIDCQENTVVFLVSTLQYIWVALAFSVKEPWQKPMYTNVWFIAALAFYTCISVFAILVDPDHVYGGAIHFLHSFLVKFLNLVHLPGGFGFRLRLLLFCFINLLLCLAFEFVVIQRIEKADFASREKKETFEWPVVDKASGVSMRLHHQRSLLPRASPAYRHGDPTSNGHIEPPPRESETWAQTEGSKGWRNVCVTAKESAEWISKLHATLTPLDLLLQRS
uniref:Uncharacterized protein n=1 Tax=Chromera velia CCMP2878 TaxID=1169474 RepID=A0A0G4HEN5_9ALVE|eukprot:Cvel_26644.t1-p1 / transcript=Cvel_26644.t1 / gene=Cvel_26644 / organism=Chromera_velia_CCMP2878 / gene_product=Vacuolar cation-transporting ATPase YPK9, putative / transcript_product=Vacuolar cation-transporting ATPase YPK9, putative / location=Cvel_scaffold3204:7782-10912(-) / protein_length=298 / sequence_SO=supercontig / SO=protein_coding / is_pseudo=false